MSFDLWVLSYCMLLRIDSQPSTKGNGGFYDGFHLCGDIGRDDCFGGDFNGGGFGNGTNLMR